MKNFNLLQLAFSAMSLAVSATSTTRNSLFLAANSLNHMATTSNLTNSGFNMYLVSVITELRTAVRYNKNTNLDNELTELLTCVLEVNTLLV